VKFDHHGWKASFLLWTPDDKLSKYRNFARSFRIATTASDEYFTGPSPKYIAPIPKLELPRRHHSRPCRNTLLTTTKVINIQPFLDICKGVLNTTFVPACVYTADVREVSPLACKPLKLTIVKRSTSHELFTWIGPAVRASCHCRVTHKITYLSGRLSQLNQLLFTYLPMCRLSTYQTNF
jgi:hypothetical protein